MVLRRQICNVLAANGSLSVRELQQQLGKGSRGQCTLYVLDYFTHIGGLSPDLRGALYTLLWREEIEIVPVRRSLRLRLSR
jgi:hypothetical protein